MFGFSHTNILNYLTQKEGRQTRPLGFIFPDQLLPQYPHRHKIVRTVITTDGSTRTRKENWADKRKLHNFW